jgi:hypothetical protein
MMTVYRPSAISPLDLSMGGRNEHHPRLIYFFSSKFFLA